MANCAPEEPGTDGDRDPGKGCKRENQSDGRARQPNPENTPECRQCNAAQSSAESVDCGDGATAIGAVVACPSFVLFLVGFDQTGAGRKNRRESKEQAAQNGAVVLCDETSGDAYTSSENESYDPLVRLYPFDGREAGPDKHRDYLTTSQSAKDTPNQIGMSERVAVRARGL